MSSVGRVGEVKMAEGVEAGMASLVAVRREGEDEGGRFEAANAS